MHCYSVCRFILLPYEQAKEIFIQTSPLWMGMDTCHVAGLGDCLRPVTINYPQCTFAAHQESNAIRFLLLPGNDLSINNFVDFNYCQTIAKTKMALG